MDQNCEMLDVNVYLILVQLQVEATSLRKFNTQMLDVFYYLNLGSLGGKCG